jgi:hypothetical protein
MLLNRRYLALMLNLLITIEGVLRETKGDLLETSHTCLHEYSHQRQSVGAQQGVLSHTPRPTEEPRPPCSLSGRSRVTRN